MSLDLDGEAIEARTGADAAALAALRDRLREVLKELTCREVGEMTGVHPESVRRYLQGRAPNADFLLSLCSAMGLNGHWLLTGQGPVLAKDVEAWSLERARPPALIRALSGSVEAWMSQLDRGGGRGG